MSKEEIFEKLRNIIINQLDIEKEKITMEATLLDDLSADSLDVVELIMNIEEEFEIEISESDSERIVTIGDIVEYIQEQI